MATKGTASSPFLKALFYGTPGSTKTRTSCTAVLDERMYPVLYLNAAGNPVSIREYEKQPTIIDVEELSDFNDPWNWIYQGQKPGHAFAQQFELDQVYKTVIVDQLTDVQRLAFKKILGATNVGPGSFPIKREWEHYNKVLYQMINFAKLFFSLNIHVIMTALETDKENMAMGTIKTYPNLEGESKNEVPGYAQMVGRLVNASALTPTLSKLITKEAGKPKDSVLFLKPSGRYVAKNQYGGLPSYIVDPTMSQIMDGVYGS